MLGIVLLILTFSSSISYISWEIVKNRRYSTNSLFSLSDRWETYKQVFYNGLMNKWKNLDISERRCKNWPEKLNLYAKIFQQEYCFWLIYDARKQYYDTGECSIPSSFTNFWMFNIVLGFSDAMVLLCVWMLSSTVCVVLILFSSKDHTNWNPLFY